MKYRYKDRDELLDILQILLPNTEQKPIVPTRVNNFHFIICQYPLVCLKREEGSLRLIDGSNTVHRIWEDHVTYKEAAPYAIAFARGDTMTDGDPITFEMIGTNFSFQVPNCRWNLENVWGRMLAHP